VAADDLVPCAVHQRVSVKFPIRPFNEGIKWGKVSLMLEVHPDGQLGDVLVFEHTGADFAEAAVFAVKKWEFTPALLAGEPVGSIVTINVQFEVNGVTAHTKLIGQAAEQAAPGGRFTYRPFTLTELDGVPRALFRAAPVYPREWILEGRTGAVTIDFFIDEDGRTRFPRVVWEADELLGAVTVDAVKGWQFEPPLRRGQAVLAQVRQMFHFRPEVKKSEP
jgi:TonB family protein